MIEKKSPLYRSFPALDGVRALSILSVIFCHLPVTMPAWLIPLRVRGELGVELFFAISGFLVTRSLFQCCDKNRSKIRIARDFFVRRVSRIFPPYFLTLGVVFLIARFLDPSLWSKMKQLGNGVLVFPFFVSNYFIPLSQSNVPDTLGITWSLAFEEQFYLFLLFSFLVFGGRHKNRGFSFVIFISGLISALYRLGLSLGSTYEFTHKNMQMFLHLRFDALAWACLSWIFFDQLAWVKKYSVYVFTAILLTVVGHRIFQDSALGWVWQAFIYAALGFFLSLGVRILCEVGEESSYFIKKLSRFLSHPWMALVGVISYEIYLIHELVIGVLMRLKLSAYPLIFSLLTFSLSIGVAWLFHRVFSLPTQRYLRGFGSSRSSHAKA